MSTLPMDCINYQRAHRGAARGARECLPAE